MIAAYTNGADLLRHLDHRMTQIVARYADSSAQKRNDGRMNWRSANALWPDLKQD